MMSVHQYRRFERAEACGKHLSRHVSVDARQGQFQSMICRLRSAEKQINEYDTLPANVSGLYLIASFKRERNVCPR